MQLPEECNHKNTKKQQAGEEFLTEAIRTYGTQKTVHISILILGEKYAKFFGMDKQEKQIHKHAKGGHCECPANCAEIGRDICM